MYPIHDKTVFARRQTAMATFGRTSGLRSRASPWALTQGSSPQFTKPDNAPTKAENESKTKNKSNNIKHKDRQLRDLFGELFGESEDTEKSKSRYLTREEQLRINEFTPEGMPENKENLQPFAHTTVKSMSYPWQFGRRKGTTFTLFPKLPIELRTMIWTLSLPGSRVVEIKRTRNDDDASPDYRSAAIVPVALHVSQESRTIAQKHYSLSFGPSIFEHAGKIWFDKNIDVLFFSCRRLSHHSEITRFLMWACDIDKIQHLAMCGAACEYLVASLGDNQILVERLKKNMKVQSLVCTSHGTSLSRKNLRIESLKTPIEYISEQLGQKVESMLGAKIKYGITKSGRW